MPRVSVICAIHNGERFLAEAVGSILGQTFADFELILIDDGSTDGTAAMLERFREADARVRYSRQPNQGLTRALNCALQMAGGEYVARQDDDDISSPERLALQVRHLDDHPLCAVVGSCYHRIDEQGRVMGRVRVPLGDFAIKAELLVRNVIAHSSATFRRKEVMELGGYDPAFVTAQDYDLWCRAALRHQLANLGEALVMRREHAGQVGKRDPRTQLENRDRIRKAYRAAVLGDGATPDPSRRAALRTLARFHGGKDAVLDRVRRHWHPAWMDRV